MKQMKPSGDHISHDRRGGDMTAKPGTPNGRSRDSPEPVNEAACHRRCQRAALPPQTHHEASISAGPGQGDQPTKTALPGEAGNSTEVSAMGSDSSRLFLSPKAWMVQNADKRQEGAVHQGPSPAEWAWASRP